MRAAAVVAAVLALAVAVAVSWQSSQPAASSAPVYSVPSTPRSALPAPPSWGTYRPNLYLGVRGLWPSSPLFGWAWSCATANAGGAVCGPEQQVSQIRHDAEERDGVSKYGWLQHDGRSFGVQSIVDRKMGVNLTTSFVLHADGQRWVMRISGEAPKPLQGSAKQQEADAISLYFYTALTSPDQAVEIVSKTGKRGMPGAVAMDLRTEHGTHRLHAGAVPGKKNFSPTIEEKEGLRSYDRTYFLGRRINPEQLQGQGREHPWQAKEHIARSLTDNYRQRHETQAKLVRELTEAHEAAHKHVEDKSKIPPPFIPEPPQFVGTLSNTVEANSNFLVVQRILEVPFSMDFVLQPLEGAPQEAAFDPMAQPVQGAEVGGTESWFAVDSSQQGGAVDQEVERRKQKFDKEFAAKFPLSREAAHKQKEFAQSLLSNLVGGIGYFSGRQLIEDAPAKPARGKHPAVPAVVREDAEGELLTAVPSRSFFPRGFMWDEGFHQLLVSRWDLALSLRILGSWFARIDATSKPLPGWLPREQILGEEARRRVPPEFRAQKPWVANPPTLILALEKILDRLLAKESAERAKGSVSAATRAEIDLFNSFLHTWLPTLHMHVQWFFGTQASVPGSVESVGRILEDGRTAGSMPHSFRWAGRTLDHCLASGLDDYPRARFLPSLAKDKVPNEAQSARDSDAGLAPLVATLGAEGHVDLHAWMIVLAKTMAGLTEYSHKHSTAAAAVNATATGEQTHYAKLSATYDAYATSLSKSLLQLHWNAAATGGGSFADFAYRNGTRQFVPHVGYVSLLPLFLTVLDPASPELLAILQQLKSDAWSVWSNAGLRSLSQRDREFGSKEDYWRGHIWINMQHLACQALSHYAEHKQSPAAVRTLAASLSSELRANVAKNVAKEYARTGFVWEQYHALDGKGRKSHPFTGWTALTLLVMTEK